MQNRWVCVFVTSVGLMLATALLGLPASDRVTVQGKVEYWDRLAGQYKPAKDVFVEVEGDWWWRPDPEVQTDDSGFYKASVENPPWWWNNYDDVDIEVYAEKPNRLQVFEHMFAWYPYHAISKEVNNVKGGQTVTINVKIGGPQNNIGEAYYRTPDETANAFIVHQEMLAHYRRLRQMGFPESDFDETEVIVPAAGVNSYYNHLTGFINLVVAGLTGTGNWTNIPSGNDSFIAYKRFLTTVRHEYSHAIHDEITGVVPPLGLNMPSTHHPQMETNRFIAYTEGWAEFLPLATLNMGGRFEPTPLGSPGLNLPAGGNHYAMEGEVVGLLWDLFDPTGLEDLRHPATQTGDGFTVPKVIVDEQTWRDRLSDPNLTRIRQVVRTYAAAWPVQTIGEFLETYRKKFPSDLHALKAIAFNRDITREMPEERAAALTGTTTVSRSGNVVTLNFTLRELDPEDRPFMQIWLWHQRGNAVPTLKLSKTCSTGWSGANRSVTENVTVPTGTGNPDLLWLVVSDEMLPTAHRLTVPATGSASLAALFTDLFKKGIVVRPEEASRPLSPALRSAAGEMPAITEQTPVRTLTAEDAQRVKAFRDLIAQASRELRDGAERQEMTLRRERGLYKMAQSVGDLKVPASTPAPFLRKPLPPGRQQPSLSAAQANARQAFRQWLDQTAAGKALARPLTAQDKTLLRAHQQSLSQQVQRQQAFTARAQQLTQQLRSALNAIPFGAESALVQENAKAALADFEAKMGTPIIERDLLSQMQKQNAVLNALTQ